MADYKFVGYVDDGTWEGSLQIQVENLDHELLISVFVHDDEKKVVSEKLLPGDSIDRRVRKGDTVTIEAQGSHRFTVEFLDENVCDAKKRQVTSMTDPDKVRTIAVADNRGGGSPVEIQDRKEKYVARQMERAEVIVNGGDVIMQAPLPAGYGASVKFQSL